MANAVDLAYLAGIIDGEGTVTMQQSKRSYRPLLHVDSTDRELLEWIQTRWGGTIIGKTRRASHHRDSYIWRLRNQAALDLLADALPYMVIHRKRRRAELLIRDFGRKGHWTSPGWKPRSQTWAELREI